MEGLEEGRAGGDKMEAETVATRPIAQASARITESLNCFLSLFLSVSLCFS